MSAETLSEGMGRDSSLRAVAEGAMSHAYAPYSNFRVGAAVKSGDGRVFAGANVENASYGLGMCAERAAIATAVTAGARTFDALALVSDSDGPVSPCGACRQVLAEFAPDLRIISYGLNGEIAEWTVAELLPHQFRLNQGNETSK
ncbi:MAG: cytidine deaminase [Gemmatimonadaceae bacterium]